MDKKVDFVSKEMGIDSSKLILLVVAGGTTLLPKKNMISLSEYVTLVEEDRMTFYFVKSKGLFSKTYQIEESIEILFSQLEFVEFGKGSGMLFLQFHIDGELNAIVSKKDQQFKNLVENIEKTTNIIDLDLYQKLIQ
jgi:hypothetical protein